MNAKTLLATLSIGMFAQGALAQGAGGPPPQAYEDCRGKTAGDVVQQMTREGLVAATCESSPEGLIARPGSKPSASSGNTSSASPSSSPTSAPTKPASTRASRTGFTLTTTAGADGSTLPIEYSCDGTGVSPALQWSNAPAGTQGFALMISTIPVDGSTRWNWVLYGIPKSATGLPKNTSGIGTLGATSHDLSVRYEPPCPNGPGAKRYTFTLYALSAAPVLPDNPAKVTGAVLSKAISAITLDTASFTMSYTRR